MKFRVFCLIAALSAAACTDGSEPAAARVDSNELLPKPLHADGAYLRDEEGRAVLLHGVNWSGSWKLAPYGQDATEWTIAYLAGLGLNNVRLLTGWAAVMPERGRIDRSYLADLRERARWAAKYDMLIVIDMHQDIYGEGIVNEDTGWSIGNGAPAWTCGARIKQLDPWTMNYTYDRVGECYHKMYTDPELVALFADAHRALLETLGDIPNVIGLELLNEPFFGTASPLSFERNELFPFYEQVYARIATAAAGHLIFAEPSIVKNLSAFTIFNRLPGTQWVYSPHLYDVRMELGGAYDGVTSYLDYRMSLDAREQAMHGIPLWWGEWGNPPGGPSAEDYVGDFIDRADGLYFGWAFWDNSLLKDHTMPHGVSYAGLGIMRAYVERAPGAPLFHYDAAARKLTLTITGDGAAETWVRAPKGWSAKVALGAGWGGQAKTKGEYFTRIILPPAPQGSVVTATLTFTAPF